MCDTLIQWFILGVIWLTAAAVFWFWAESHLRSVRSGRFEDLRQWLLGVALSNVERSAVLSILDYHEHGSKLTSDVVFKADAALALIVPCEERTQLRGLLESAWDGQRQ